MKKIKLRFSYFIIAGIIALTLQATSYFLWGANDLVASQLTNSTTKEYFNTFMSPSYALIFAGVFFIIFAIGIFMAAKEKDWFTKGSAIGLGVSQIVIIISLVVFLIFAEVNRKTMFSNDTNALVLRVLAVIKNAGMFVSSIALCLIGITFVKANKNRKIGRIASYCFLIVNGLFVLSMIVVFFGAIGTPSFDLLSRFFETEQTLANPFTSKYASMNGLTFGNTYRVFMLIQETISPARKGDYAYITTGAIFTFISCISFFVSLVFSFLSLSGMLIESFDVERDEKPMEM